MVKCRSSYRLNDAQYLCDAAAFLSFLQDQELCDHMIFDHSVLFFLQSSAQ